MVADRLAGLRDQFGLAGILAELNTGGLIPHEKVMRSVQLLCEKGFSAVPALTQRAFSGVTGCLENPRDTRDGPEIPGFRAAVLQVRIHFPPAVSRANHQFLASVPVSSNSR